MLALSRAARLLATLLLIGGCASPGPRQFDAQLPERVELAGVPFFPQQRYQCGPAALSTMLVQRGVATSPEQLLPQVYLPGRQGSLKVELVAAARQHDLLVYPLEPRLEALLAQVAAGHPVLVMQNLGLDWWPQWHFAVVVGYDLSREELLLRSATEKRLLTPFRLFERSWARAERWAVLTLPPERLPAQPQLTTWLQAASDLEQTGRGAAAQRAYRTAEHHWPQAALPSFAMGNARYADGDRAAAEAALRESVRRQGDFAVGWFNLSEVLNEAGCVAQARAARHCARQLAPQDARLSAPLVPLAGSQARCAALPSCPRP
ncbi:MAG: PA2778 family cysteine peptidase [Pseudomonadaceae bacterium]|nr:PA2778 family cysteine peptidase [Pseudomonadaceae bacterium]